MKSSKGTQNDAAGYNLPSDLSQPAVRALTGAGFYRLEQLNGVSEADILKLHGVGKKAIASLQRALEAEGFAFGNRRISATKGS